MLKFILSSLLFLGGCRLNFPKAPQALADSTLPGQLDYVTYQLKTANWDYAARVLPVGLMEKLRNEVSITEGYEPDRFSAMPLDNSSHQPLWLYTMQTHCNDQATCQKYDEDWQQFHPGCMGRAGCSYGIYVKEDREYRVLFGFAIFSYKSPKFFQVSVQRTQKGYPKCFRVVGYDGHLQFEDDPFHQQYDPQTPLLMTYCYEAVDDDPDFDYRYSLKDVQRISADFSPTSH